MDRIEYLYYLNDDKLKTADDLIAIAKSDNNISEYLAKKPNILKLKGVKYNNERELAVDVMSQSYLKNSPASDSILYHRKVLLGYRYYVTKGFIERPTANLTDVIYVYAKATFSIKRKMAASYPQIKAAEYPITAKIYNGLRKKSSKSSGKVMASVGGGRKYKVTLITPNGEYTIECSENTYILDAAEENGITLPYSCRCGADGTSAAKIVSGIVDQSDQSYISDCQIDQGFVLLDVAYPRTDLQIVTHQENYLNDFSFSGTNCLKSVEIKPEPYDPGPPPYIPPGETVPTWPGGNGGGPNPSPPDPDPCAKVKQKTSAKEFKEKVDALKDKLDLKEETGYQEKKDGTFSELDNAGDNSLNANPDASTQGFIHTHTNSYQVGDVGDNGLVKTNYPIHMFSPRDVNILMNIINVNRNSTDYSSFYISMVSSSGNYMIKFDGAATDIKTGFNTDQWTNAYREFMIRYSSLEKGFLKFLKEKMNINGVQLYEIRNNGNVRKINLKPNGKSLDKKDC